MEQTHTHATIFGVTITADCQFIRDLRNAENTISVNNGSMPVYRLNLINAQFSFALYNTGLKPNKFFRTSDYYTYFGWSPKCRKHQDFYNWVTRFLDAVKDGEQIQVQMSTKTTKTI